MISIIKKVKKLTKAGLVILGILNVISNSWAQGDVWVQKTDMPTARFLHASSMVNEKVFVIGGCTSEPNSQVILPVEVYDPVTDSWVQKADMITGRAVLSTCEVNGMIYAIGGAGTSLVGLSTVEMYDPVTDTWTSKADMLTPRVALSISAVNGKIYAIGGTQNLTSLSGLSTVEEYDPATDTWTAKASMPTRRLGLCTAVVDGQIYAIGGSTQNPAVPVVEAYDPVTDIWTIKTDMPTARRNFATSVVDGKIYAFGGWIRSSYSAFRTVEQYDPVTDTWVTKTDLPIARSCLSACTVNRKIYAIGGTDKTHPCPALSTVLEYDVESDTTTATTVRSNAVGNPSSFKLFQNYPNPFNPSTTIRFSIPKSCFVSLKIYDLLGKEITTLINGKKSSGEYAVDWNGKGLPSGMYLYQLKAGEFAETRKLILQK
jgi:N-acetylneuraminic acid mutarotase